MDPTPTPPKGITNAQFRQFLLTAFTANEFNEFLLGHHPELHRRYDTCPPDQQIRAFIDQVSTFSQEKKDQLSQLFHTLRPKQWPQTNRILPQETTAARPGQSIHPT